MIDQFFQTAAETLLNRIHAFLALPNEQKEIICMKLLLEILAIVFAVWLGKKVGRAGKRKSVHHSGATGKGFKPKKWRTDGYYYDEEKKKWIEPDFKQIHEQ